MKSESSGRPADGLKGRESQDSISQKFICTVQIINRSQSAPYDYVVGNHEFILLLYFISDWNSDIKVRKKSSPNIISPSLKVTSAESFQDQKNAPQFFPS